MTEMYYFGCRDELGHLFWKSSERVFFRVMENISPWGVQIDGKLAPAVRNKRGYIEREEAQGVCALHHKKGWTAIAFWDRSIDDRGASNSVFMVEGIYDFDAMVEMAKEQYPDIMRRFKFELKLFQGELEAEDYDGIEDAKNGRR